MGDRSVPWRGSVNGTELHAALHVEACGMAILRDDFETTLAQAQAMRLRAEAALERARAHIIPAQRFIKDMSGAVHVQVD